MAPAKLDEIGRLAKEGRHWMFTPFRELTLVHATQRPLEAPQFSDLAADRFRDDTSAHLRGVIDLHAPSTAKLDLLASWTEPRDDPALPETRRRGRAMPTSWRFPIATSQCQSLILLNYVAHDMYVLTLEDDRILTFDTLVRGRVGKPVAQPAGHPAGRRRRRAAGEGAPADGEDHRPQLRRHQAPSRALSRDGYVPLPRVFTRAVLDDPGSDRGGAGTGSGGQRPDRPRRLRYVLPTFGWSTEDDGTDRCQPVAWVAGCASTWSAAGGRRAMASCWPWY